MEIGARRRFYIRGYVDSRGDLQTRIRGLDRQVALPILGLGVGGVSVRRGLLLACLFRRVCFWRVLCKVLWGSEYTLPERLEVGWDARGGELCGGVLSSIGI